LKRNKLNNLMRPALRARSVPGGRSSFWPLRSALAVAQDAITSVNRLPTSGFIFTGHRQRKITAHPFNHLTMPGVLRYCQKYSRN
jgi:hypothetical protein